MHNFHCQGPQHRDVPELRLAVVAKVQSQSSPHFSANSFPSCPLQLPCSLPLTLPASGNPWYTCEWKLSTSSLLTEHVVCFHHLCLKKINISAVNDSNSCPEHRTLKTHISFISAHWKSFLNPLCHMGLPGSSPKRLFFYLRFPYPVLLGALVRTEKTCSKGLYEYSATLSAWFSTSAVHPLHSKLSINCYKRKEGIPHFKILFNFKVFLQSSLKFS